MKKKFEQLLMRYLRKRGWVVFYLDEVSRNCCNGSVCWMELYNSEMKRS